MYHIRVGIDYMCPRLSSQYFCFTNIYVQNDAINYILFHKYKFVFMSVILSGFLLFHSYRAINVVVVKYVIVT